MTLTIQPFKGAKSLILLVLHFVTNDAYRSFIFRSVISLRNRVPITKISWKNELDDSSHGARRSTYIRNCWYLTEISICYGPPLKGCSHNRHLIVYRSRVPFDSTLTLMENAELFIGQNVFAPKKSHPSLNAHYGILMIAHLNVVTTWKYADRIYQVIDRNWHKRLICNWIPSGVL